MKYLKYLFAVAFTFLVLSADVSADELGYLDFHEYLGISYDEFLEFEVEPGYYSGYFPNVYSDFNPDYVKDEHIKISGLSWANVYNGGAQRFGTTSFGQWNVLGNLSDSVEITLLNSGHPLFDNGGILTFKVMVYCEAFTYTITYDDGSFVSCQPISSNSGRTDYEFDFDNTGNDIIKIVFKWSGGISQSSGDRFIGFGLVDYGYLADDEPEPEDPEVPLVGSDLSGTISFALSFIVSIVDTLFLLQIVEGVTLGYFIIACMIFGLVFSFLFRNMVK